MRIEWLYEARCEFEEQLAYYRSRGGEEAVAGFAGKILGAVERLAKAPRAGVLRRETLLGKHGFRALLVEQYACIYRIEDGVVRVYHLTDASKDNLYEILGVASDATDREVRGTMRNNVFLKSTLRQPVKTALLLAVIALITFAFVSRGAEYLLVKQETERLGEYYKSVGVLNGGWRDTSEAAAYLEAREDVETINTYRQISGVIQDGFCNAEIDNPSMGDLRNWNNSGSFSLPERRLMLEQPPMKDYMAFYGVLQGWDDTTFYFRCESVLSGYSDYITEGWGIRLLRSTPYLDLSAWDGAEENLEKGQRYLAIGYFAFYDDQCKYVPQGMGESKEDECFTQMQLYPVTEEDYFVPAPVGETVDLSAREFSSRNTARIVRWSYDEQRALNLIATEDMTILPTILGEHPEIYLADGRWLDGSDHAGGKKTCVVHAGLAAMRGLHTGDHITLKLRDIPSYIGHFLPTQQMGYDELDKVNTETDTFEIVGIYDYTKPYRFNNVTSNTYIPASAVPSNFVHIGIESLHQATYIPYTGDLLASGLMSTPPDQVSFSLTTPDAASRLLTETREDLAAMGFEVEFLENNWDEFQAVTGPMKASSLLNAVVFSALLLVTFCLLAVVYYRMRRKEISIVRALGVPARRCTRDASIPLLLLGMLGIAGGACLGWQYTLENAAGTLSALSDLGEEVIPSLPVHWLAVLGGGAFGLLLAMTLGGAAFLSSRPVLALVQGGALTARRDRTETAQAVGAAVPGGAPAYTAIPVRRAEAAVSAESGRGSAGHVLRFVWRHISRAKLKSALSILLAAGFTAGLAAIQLSIASSQERIDWLYENTAVEAELLLADSSQDIKGGGFLRQSTVDALLDSGYVTDAYLEGSTKGAVARYAPGMETGRGLHILEKDMSKQTIRLFVKRNFSRGGKNQAGKAPWTVKSRFRGQAV